MDARDSVDGPEDFVGSAAPAPPRKPRPPRDPERVRMLLLQVVAAAAVATAVFTGFTAWDTHQDRNQTKIIYCAFYDDDSGSSGDESYDRQQKQLRDDLGC